MKKRSLLIYLLVGVLSLGALPMHAQEVKASTRFAGNGPSTRVSYNREKGKLYHGIVATFSGIVFSGDIAKAWPILWYGALGDNIGGSATLNYKLTFNPYVSMRFGIQAGYLQGSNAKIMAKDKKVTSPHEFKSVIIEPYFGVEVYPILNYGWFLYAGFGVTESCIQYYKHERRSVLYEEKNVLGVLPMFQFGTGYNWWLDRNWTLGIELMGQVGVMDDVKNSIDGWPNDAAFILNHTDPVKKASEEEAYRKAKAPDGWFQIGMVISYHFN